jgi:FHS family L-fucose permease-like MFS transporter
MSQLYYKSRKSITSALVVLSTAFFMWGLITGLNLMLVDELQTVFQMSPVKAFLVSFLFYATYFVVAYPAGKIINRFGYKNTIIAGIVLAGFGCMLFYPAAESQSYELFVLSLFILASGLTLLQVSANAFVVLIGQRNRGAARLTMVQAFNALGAFLAPLFASGLFMKLAGLTEESRLRLAPEEFVMSTIKYVQLPYLGLGAILFLLALFVGFSPLPKLNTELTEPLPKADKPNRKYILQYPHVLLGAIAIFCYVGAEVTIGSYLTAAATRDIIPQLAILLYWGGAMFGRFVGVMILPVISPRKLIVIASFSALALVLLYVYLSQYLGIYINSYYVLSAVGLFNSIMFPCIYTMGIDGLGKFSEEGSSVLIMAVIGGAVIPLIWGNLYNISLLASFGLIALAYLFIAFYGINGSRYEKRTNFY